jgi:transcriptional regulator with XRE-family HTH domain
MTFPLASGVLLKAARERSGLSQRALALRAGTSQSVVARIEGGRTDPGGRTLARLLAATGFEARCELGPVPVVDTHMLADVERILRLTPAERLLEVMNLSRFETAARRV